MTVTALTLFPTGPTSRRADPETSPAAVPSAAHLSMLQTEVLALHRRAAGLTDDELVQAMPHRCAGTLVKRRSELAHAGLIVATARRRPTRTGRPAIIWTVV